MTRKPAEDREKQVLLFIWKFYQQKRVIPSYDEIVLGTGIKSKSHVQKIIRSMKAAGWIAQVPGCSRSIHILPKGEQICARYGSLQYTNRARREATYINQAAAINGERLRKQIEIPIVGRTFAGELTMMPAAGGEISVDKDYALSVYEDMLPPKSKPGELFVLEVQGDSMIEADINDGDYIVVQRAEAVENGQMAVVWFDDTHETTLKYFFKENDGYRLQPANSSMDPIIVGKDRKLSIMGKVVRVVASKTPAA